MERIPRCPYCGRARKAVKAGRRKTQYGAKQMYRCKACKRKFTPGKFSKMRFPQNIIRTALRLRRRGESYRRISAALLLTYDVDVSDVTVMKWVKKFGAERQYQE